MNKVTYRVTLDLTRPGVQHTIYAKKDDAHSRKVVFTLRAGSKAYSIDDATSAYLYALVDGAEIFADCEISGSMITAELTTNILAGKSIIMELRLTDGTGAVLTTPQVKVVSEEALYSEDAITATNDYSALLNAITAAENSRIVDITSNGNVLTITYKDGTSVSVELGDLATEQWVSNQLKEYLPSEKLQNAIEDALAQAKESGEFDGEDGISITHSWNGTILTIESASGKSSMDLKGDPYTLTTADKTDIVSDVIEALPKYKGEYEYV